MTPIDPAAPAGYERFFGLKEPPFSLAPDPRFLFASASHSAALTEIAYAIDRREPIVVVTGEIGTGKTLLCRTVLRRLPRKTFVSVVDDPLLGPDELLTQLLRDFGVVSRDRAPAPGTSRHELVQALVGFLRSLAAIQAHAVVIIDEAQHLQPAVLEQIRLLSNVDDERGTLLQIILVGQSDMEPLLSLPELRQLQQRVTRRFRLEPLSGAEVQQYIEHRLARAREGVPVSNAPGATELARALVDWEGPVPPIVFDAGALDEIARLSGGVPRVVNLICDRALERACAAGVHQVDAAIADDAAGALGIDRGGEPVQDALESAAEPEIPIPELRPPARARGFRRVLVAAVLLVAAAAAAWIGFRALTRRSVAPSAAATSAPVARPAPPAARPATAAAPPPARGSAPPVNDLPREPSTAEPTAPSPTAAATPSAARGGFEIVVASFKTESRATAVQSELVGLGFPSRVRAQGNWQQVVCGPFASRDEADAARRRVEAAGYVGAQVMAASR